MNNRLIEDISKETDQSQETIELLMKDFIDLMLKHGESLNDVYIDGFGSFKSEIREEREALHPATGERLLLPPKVIMTFTPSTSLKIKK